jgi:hypothetical protein
MRALENTSDAPFLTAPDLFHRMEETPDAN